MSEPGISKGCPSPEFQLSRASLHRKLTVVRCHHGRMLLTNFKSSLRVQRVGIEIFTACWLPATEEAIKNDAICKRAVK